jgi:hypothetical protein
MEQDNLSFDEVEEISDYIFLDSRRYDSHMKGE